MNGNRFGQSVERVCFEESDDELLAQGYPHLARLVDGHSHDKKAPKWAKKAIESRTSRYRIDWPRKVAAGICHAARLPKFKIDGVALSEVPPTPEEARAAIEAALVPRNLQRPGGVSLPYILEAFVGTEVVVEAMVGAIEARSIKHLSKDHRDRRGTAIVQQLGFLLLRVEPGPRDAWKSRIAAVLEAVDAQLATMARSVRSDFITELDRIVRGAFRPSTPPTYTYLYPYAHAVDPVLIRELLTDKETLAAAISVRFIYVAGPDVLDDLAIAPMADHLAAFAEDIGIFRHEAVARYLLDLVGKRSAKKHPMAWFEAHADFARPVLERLASGQGPRSERARMVLSTIAPASTTPVGDYGTPPPILASPPWRAAPGPIEIGPAPEPLTHDDAIVWRHNDSKSYPPYKWLNEMSMDTVRKHFKSDPSALLLPRFEDDEALALWNGKKLYADRGTMLQQLVRFDVAGIPGVVLAARASFVDAEPMLIRTSSVSLVPLMVRAMGSKRNRTVAEAWLKRFPETAAVGLLPLVFGRKTKARAAARQTLRAVASTHREIVDDVARRAGRSDAIGAVLDARPAPVIEAPPSWLRMEALPELRVEDGPLGPEAVAEVVALLMLDLEDPGLDPAWFDGLEQAVVDLPGFAWALVTAWMAAGGPPDALWTLDAVGAFGDDEAATQLDGLIREWGKRSHARASRGLAALARIGSDASLSRLADLAARLRFPALKRDAVAQMDAVAVARGLTPAQLADRVVPTVGLDEHGTQTLDFGPRSFVVGFDEHLVPFVCDEAGKRRKTLPKAGSKDDSERASAARARFKSLKRDVRKLAASQIRRLEAAMCDQRRWPIADFKAFFVSHPLLGHLVRRLVWAAFTEDGTATFRVTHDGFTTCVDDEFVLEKGTIGLVHPLEADLEAWGTLLADYEIIQPFPQIGRETWVRSDADAVVGQKVPTGAILGLQNRGWVPGEARDSGGIWEYFKVVPGGRIALQLDPGIIAGDVAFTPTQILHRLDFPEVAIGPVVMSELVRDLRDL